VSDDLMPAAFIGHGNPMNTLDHNRYTDAWRQLGAGLPRPRAILAVSAHWYTSSTATTAMAAPRTIHDFYGFPDELFAVEYPAPGDPALAAEIGDVVAPTHVSLDIDSWGLDHGTWWVLAHMYPAADIPVVQLSINANRPLEHHFELGAALAPLRERGVLIIGSGNVVHNLGLVEWSQPDVGFDWAHRFDDAARAAVTADPASVLGVIDHPDFALAAPTPDHVIPMLYVAGLAAAAGSTLSTLVDGYAMGSLSMTSYTLDASCDPEPETEGAPPLPKGPADETNT
jgi:4,5-DOPA dioxygenase extradiol